MILPFSTNINGKETLFPEKIMTGLNHAQIITWDHTEELFETKIISKSDTCHRIEFNKSIITNPKLHTIREDKNDRWKVGTKIDFFINARQKDMFRFAPVLPVVSTQKVELIYIENIKELTCLGITYDRTCTIKIDNKFYGDAYLLADYVVSSSYNLTAFAQNDGFDNLEDFFVYFDKNYLGKIIHWTDLKY